MLQGAAELLVARAREAGVPVVYGETRYATHMIHLFAEAMPEANEAMEELTSMVRLLLAGGVARHSTF